MAWTENCKIQFRESLESYVKHGLSVRAALRKLAEETDYPYDTLKDWKYGKKKTPKNNNKSVVENHNRPESLPDGEQYALEVVESERPGKSQFNQTNDNIEWARWTWNPVTGCLHDCDYCYARDIALRFPDTFGNGFSPSFHPSRLTAPLNTPRPKSDVPGSLNVFVCSMADLFGRWVPNEWIDKVLDAVSQAPRWKFLFLTKNPQRYADFHFPDNSWIGATVDVQSRVDETMQAMERATAPIKFISCEPLLEKITFPDFKCIDWLIVGACSRTSRRPELQPHWSWVEHLLRQARRHKTMVYFKPNLTIRPREYPR